MFRQFLCHLQFWFIQSTKLNIKCLTKCWLDIATNSNRTMYALQGKFLINMIKLMIKCRFLPLYVDSFNFTWKVVDAWSKMLKHSSEHRVRHCGELYKCLKMLEVLLAKPLGIYPHICVSTWSVIGPLTFSDIWHTRTIVWSYFCVVATATYLCFSIFFPSIDVFPIPNPQCGKLVVAFFDVRRCWASTDQKLVKGGNQAHGHCMKIGWHLSW